MATWLTARSRPTFWLAFLVATMVAGCSTATPNTNASIEGEWTVVSVGDAVVDPAIEVRLRFDNGSMTGNAGCNGIRGDYSRDNQSLSFGPVARTKRLCPGPRMDVEERVLAVLAKVDTLEVTGAMMTLTGGAGQLDLKRSQ